MVVKTCGNGSQIFKTQKISSTASQKFQSSPVYSRLDHLHLPRIKIRRKEGRHSILTGEALVPGLLYHLLPILLHRHHELVEFKGGELGQLPVHLPQVVVGGGVVVVGVGLATQLTLVHRQFHMAAIGVLGRVEVFNYRGGLLAGDMDMAVAESHLLRAELASHQPLGALLTPSPLLADSGLVIIIGGILRALALPLHCHRQGPLAPAGILEQSCQGRPRRFRMKSRLAAGGVRGSWLQDGADRSGSSGGDARWRLLLWHSRQRSARPTHHGNVVGAVGSSGQLDLLPDLAEGEDLLFGQLVGHLKLAG